MLEWFPQYAMTFIELYNNHFKAKICWKILQQPLSTLVIRKKSVFLKIKICSPQKLTNDFAECLRLSFKPCLWFILAAWSWNCYKLMCLMHCLWWTLSKYFVYSHDIDRPWRFITDLGVAHRIHKDISSYFTFSYSTNSMYSIYRKVNKRV